MVLAQILTIVYKDLVSHIMEFVNGHDESIRSEINTELEDILPVFSDLKEKMEEVSLKYWDLVKKRGVRRSETRNAARVSKRNTIKNTTRRNSRRVDEDS